MSEEKVLIMMLIVLGLIVLIYFVYKTVQDAKREEEIYTVTDEYPIVLAKKDYVLKLLQRIRDEAHRFAITYHRSIRSKRMLSSALDSIEGIGEKRRKLLIKKFGTVEEIKKATVEELTQVESIGLKQAQNIKKYFEEES